MDITVPKILWMLFSRLESTSLEPSGEVRAVEEQERKKGIDRERELREQQFVEQVRRFAAALRRSFNF